MKKLLISSHAYISPENLVKPRLLADNFVVGLLIPQKWQAMGRKLLAKQLPQENRFKIYPLRLAFSGNAGKHFYCLAQLFFVFLKFRPNIVYLEEEPWTPSAGQLILFAKLFGVKQKVIFSWENLDVALSWWQKLLKRFVLANINLAVAGNKEGQRLLQNYLRRHGNNAPVKVNAQFGVDLTHFSPKKEEQPSNKFIIGFVGRFVEAKGIDTLIKTIALLPRDCQLLLVSTTKLPQKFVKLAKKERVFSRLRVVEGTPHQDLPQYLQKMSVFILPSKTTSSWKEQFGRVLIEAMACGLPVIGSNSGAIPEVIGKAGLIFDEGNEKDLANKIKQIKNNPQTRERLAKASLLRARKFYSHEVVTTRLAEILLTKR